MGLTSRRPAEDGSWISLDELCSRLGLTRTSLTWRLRRSGIPIQRTTRHGRSFSRVERALVEELLASEEELKEEEDPTGLLPDESARHSLALFAAEANLQRERSKRERLLAWARERLRRHIRGTNDLVDGHARLKAELETAGQIIGSLRARAEAAEAETIRLREEVCSATDTERSNAAYLDRLERELAELRAQLDQRLAG